MSTSLPWVQAAVELCLEQREDTGKPQPRDSGALDQAGREMESQRCQFALEGSRWLSGHTYI